MLTFWTILLAVVALVALALARVRVPDQSGGDEDRGWVYFLSPEGGSVDDPPAPIKIGMTRRNPWEGRLPEIETMSPKPLEILWTIQSSAPEALERAIHKELQPFRAHGEWFDRNAVLAWLDHVQGAA